MDCPHNNVASYWESIHAYTPNSSVAFLGLLPASLFSSELCRECEEGASFGEMGLWAFTPVNPSINLSEALTQIFSSRILPVRHLPFPKMVFVEAKTFMRF